jgi:Domain of unknown function (DUF4400)
MIRFVFIAAMVAILCIVLYIPSAIPAQTFLDVLRSEHALNERVWGESAATRIMSRMLDMQQVSTPLSEAPPSTQHAGQQSSVDAAVAAQMSQMNARLFGNPYFRAIDSLLVLVCYRVSAAVELLPLLLVFCFVVLVDGCMLRLVRAKEFIAHSAELFGGSVVVAIALGTAVAVAFFLPFQVHPMYVMLCLLAMLFVLSRAVANYHAIR